MWMMFKLKMWWNCRVMGRTEYLYFTGKCKWAKLAAPDKFGKYSIVLYPKPDDLARLKTLGLKNPIKVDPKAPEDGEKIVFSRPLSKQIRGKIVGFAPPIVMMKNQEGVWMPEPNLQIGNGSDVTIKIDYYSYETPTKEKGYAARLSGIRVDNLVPYNPRSDMILEDKEAAEGLETQPEQLW